MHTSLTRPARRRCKFEHPLDRMPLVDFNSLGLPMRPGVLQLLHLPLLEQTGAHAHSAILQASRSAHSL